MITKSDPNYGKIIMEHDSRHYDILAKKIPANEKIVCPQDPDMCVSRTATGEIFIHKKSYTKRVFTR